MRVDESWNDGVPAGVDAPGIAPGKPFRLVVEGGNSTIPDGHFRSAGLPIVECANDCVFNCQVRRQPGRDGS